MATMGAFTVEGTKSTMDSMLCNDWV